LPLRFLLVSGIVTMVVEAGKGSKLAARWTVGVPFVTLNSYLFEQGYTEQMECFADLMRESDRFICSIGMDKAKTREAGFAYGSYDSKGAGVVVKECYLEDNVPAVDTEIPESTTALLNMPNSKIINVYLKLNSTADLDKIDTWTNVRSGNLTNDRQEVMRLGTRALSHCQIQFDNCYNFFGKDDAGVQRAGPPPCAEFAGDWNQVFDSEDGPLASRMTCCRGTNGASPNTVVCSYENPTMNGFMRGKVNDLGTFLEGKWYEMTSEDGGSPQNGTCNGGSATWLMTNWPVGYMGQRTVDGIVSFLAALAGEVLFWDGVRVEAWPSPPAPPPCSFDEPCNNANHSHCMRFETVMITCAFRAAVLQNLIIMVTGITSAVLCVGCSYICYMKKFAPGAPGINCFVCERDTEDLVSRKIPKSRE